MGFDFQYDDGGRAAAGFQGTTGDCVIRAVAIATGKKYLDVYNTLSYFQKNQKQTKKTRGRKSSRYARNGVYVKRQWFQDLMKHWGFTWTATMGIGTGCKVHLDELGVPSTGIFICSVSKHYTTVFNGVIRDTFNPDRDGKRCVYGYWELTNNNNQTMGVK